MGAGPRSTFAERVSTLLQWKCPVIEKTNHQHRYVHTNKQQIAEYLSEVIGSAPESCIVSDPEPPPLAIRRRALKLQTKQSTPAAASPNDEGAAPRLSVVVPTYNESAREKRRLPPLQSEVIQKSDASLR